VPAAADHYVAGHPELVRAAFLVDPVDITRYSPESPENPSGEPRVLRKPLGSAGWLEGRLGALEVSGGLVGAVGSLPVGLCCRALAQGHRHWCRDFLPTPAAPNMQLCCSGAGPGEERAPGGHQRRRRNWQLQPCRRRVPRRVWRGRQRQLAGPDPRQALCCSGLLLQSAARAAAVTSAAWPADSAMHGPHCLACTPTHPPPAPSAEAGHGQFADAGCIVNAAADALCGRGKDSRREVTELTATPMLAWLWDQMVAQQQAPAPAPAARQKVRQEERAAQPGASALQCGHDVWVEPCVPAFDARLPPAPCCSRCRRRQPHLPVQQKLARRRCLPFLPGLLGSRQQPS
jgi:hypothetical protein